MAHAQVYAMHHKVCLGFYSSNRPVSPQERLRKLEEKRAPPPPPPEPETEEKMDVPTPPIPLAQALSQGSGTSGQGTLSQGTREPEEDTAAALEVRACMRFIQCCMCTASVSGISGHASHDAS